MTAYQIVTYGKVTVGVGMVSGHPQTEYLFGWLRDLVVRDTRLHGGAGAAAGTLAALVRETWPHRPFFVEVPRKDQLGSVRVTDDGDPVSTNRPN